MPEEESDKPLAFVLMPFDAEFDDVYSDLIAAPLLEAGFEVRRADSLLNQRNILADVVTGIADADLIVADVTGLNPNVMYELGLAHALGKRTVMITQTLELLPFDLQPYRANEYSLNFKEAGKIATTLREVGVAVVNADADFGNPVQDFAPEALAGGAQVQTGPRSRVTKAAAPTSGDDEDEGDRGGYANGDIGFLEGIAMVETSSERTRVASEAIGAETISIGEKFDAATARLNQIQKNLGPEKALQPSLAAMRDVAKDLEQYADTVIPMNEDLRLALAELVVGANVVARLRSINDAGDLERVQGELDALDNLTSTLVESYFSTSNFSTTIASLPQMESHLTRAARRAASVVAETATVLESAQAEIDRVRGLLQARVDGRG